MSYHLSFILYERSRIGKVTLAAKQPQPHAYGQSSTPQG